MNHLQQADKPVSGRARRRLTQLAGAVALACAILPAARADTIIDFEGVPTNLIGSYDPIGPLNQPDIYVSNGFYVGAFSNSVYAQPGDLVGAFVQGSDSSCWNLACPTADSNPSRYLVNLDSGVIDIFHTTGQSFSIKSFDASFVGAYDSGTYPTYPGLIRIQGFLADGSGYLTQTYVLDGPGSDGFEFGHYLTSGAFSTAKFSEVLIFGFTCPAGGGNCTAFDSNTSQFAIDNIYTTAVPEPETWLMYGSGLLGLAAAARRRRRSA
ncbi:PEP-CTERM sorting domain-containing protein [Duganella sp. FT80W]|uniref:PEP-CTERM sorting domain-containing protein n=1 Tax=Duganella guangzhouensis TaxID=2666084 RepID=A0A6I2L867_9BURK|nr:NF038120 family PEP-CTERM protein [Duganella guangzhouensis]MRW93054.1 PEP-CTERM sorting domain-containing protein [Duganella guangzhouensis]